LLTIALGCFAAALTGCGWESHPAVQAADESDPSTSISVHSPLPYLISPNSADLGSGDSEDDGARGLLYPPQENAFRMEGGTPDAWLFDEWAHSDPVRLSDLRGKVVVVRFFDLDSEACERSMKAMQQLHQEFQGQSVMFVGVYRTSSYGRGAEWQTVLDQLAQWGVTFPVARDKRGITLDRWWLRYFQNVPHTPAFVIGSDGRMVHVQPGPEFHPSEDLMFALCNQDYLAFRDAIQTALPQDVARRSTGTDAVADVP
jgi:peroxiredoxin